VIEGNQNIDIVPAAEAPRVALALRCGPEGRN
jgi:hypothetical protein